MDKLYIVLFCIISCVTALPKPYTRRYRYPFPFVSREEWGARASGTAVSALTSPVPLVVVHHSYIPPECNTRKTCSEHMQYMQDLHQINNGWQDIGYNFAVGGDGAVYEGRGWQTVGAHAFGFNTRSIGIVLIGDFISKLPTKRQLQVTKQLIEAGVELGHIRPQYQVVGHRQVSPTECPGDALFSEISTWEHHVKRVST